MPLFPASRRLAAVTNHVSQRAALRSRLGQSIGMSIVDCAHVSCAAAKSRSSRASSQEKRAA